MSEPVSPGRTAALETLRRTARGQRLDRAFDVVVRSAGDTLPAVERAFAHEVAWGVSRLQGRLDHLLDARLHGGGGSVSDDLRLVLRIGLYQLLRMDRVPAYAAVSQSVELAAAVGQGRAKGLVNAVLRRAGEAGEGPELFPDPEADPVGFLSTWGSHPRWLIERWTARMPFDEVRAIVEADNEIPPTHLVPFDGDLASATRALAAAGIGADPDPLSGTLRLDTLDPTAALEVVAGFVQDPAAATVCRYAAPPPGGIVADLCAAPGGKALSLARGSAYLLAADPAAGRLEPLLENVRRAGLSIGVVRARAEAPPLRNADLVLVDVPCTGTGTLRRHPDARWRLSPSAPAELAEVQARILQHASAAVSPGGLLVYSTCTLEPEENEEVVERFLAAHPEFVPAPPDDAALGLGEEWMLVRRPGRDGADGAFAARMRRIGGAADEVRES